MSLIDIYKDIKSAFGGLWQTKERGKSLEIITPYATTNNRFVSVFLSKQGDDFVVTDGGWLSSGVYDVSMNEELCFLKILNHFKASYDIKQLQNNDGTIYFYLKASNAIDITSKLFDLTLFIQNIASVSEISFEDKKEKDIKERFVSKANSFVKSFANKDKLKLNAYLNKEKKDFKFNAIYQNTPNELSLINYITGSSNFYFINSISKTNMLFDMASESNLNEHIKEKISIVDTSAEGYSPQKLSSYLNHLEQFTGSVVVDWHDREKLKVILN